MFVTVIVFLFLLTKKEGMHVDEYLSYGLANYTASSFAPECGIPLDPEEVFSNYFYTREFNLKNVWMNQKADVHPPLYYLIFHIWGIITHNFLDLQTGALLNLLIHIT